MAKFRLTLKPEAPFEEVAAGGANDAKGVYRQHFITKVPLELELDKPGLARLKLSLERKAIFEGELVKVAELSPREKRKAEGSALDLVVIEELAPAAA